MTLYYDTAALKQCSPCCTQERSDFVKLPGTKYALEVEAKKFFVSYVNSISLNYNIITYYTLLLVIHCQKSILWVFTNFQLLGKQQSGYILCVMFIYNLFVKYTSKTRLELLHSSYLKEINFRRDRFSCELIFKEANFAIFRVYLFSEIKE